MKHQLLLESPTSRVNFPLFCGDCVLTVPLKVPVRMGQRTNRHLFFPLKPMFSGFSWDMIYRILFVPFLETTSYHIAYYESHHGLTIFPSYHSIPIDWSAFTSRIQLFMIKSQLLVKNPMVSDWIPIFQAGNPYFFAGYGGQRTKRHPPRRFRSLFIRHARASSLHALERSGGTMLRKVQGLTPCFFIHMGMDQYLLIPFLGGWTSIYQLFWCSPGVQGFDTLPYLQK